MTDHPEKSSFSMHGAREILGYTGSAVQIEHQVIALESNIFGNPGLAIDLAKAITETICKTILNDRGHSQEADWELPKLIKETLSKIHLLPVSHGESTEARQKIQKTIQGLTSVIQGLCEMRNAYGIASHGQDAFTPSMDYEHALLAARSADAVIGFIYSMHRGSPSTQMNRRIAFGDHPEVNSYIDDNNHMVEIFELSYKPSEVLFQIDIDAYRDVVNSYQDASDKTTESFAETT